MSTEPPAPPDPDALRFVALGDSATCGVGDPLADGSWRGWARLLAGAIAETHDISFRNLAVPGSTTSDVRRRQLPVAVERRPQLASLIVGLNDTLRPSWDPHVVRANLRTCARTLAAQGAVLMTLRFHDHARVLRLPGPLGRALAHRIAILNEILDEIHDTDAGIRLDLGQAPEVYERRFWSFDRLHPSEAGHRALAARFGALLLEQGLSFPLPSLDCTEATSSHLDNVRWTATEVVPWLGRRARELGPVLAQTAVLQVRTRLSADCAL